MALDLTPSFMDKVRFLGVSLYLFLVAMYLILRGRLRLGMSRGRLFEVFRCYTLHKVGTFEGELAGILENEGRCYLAPLPLICATDEDGYLSTLELLENDKPLGPGHASHVDIRSQGLGRFSHWGKWIYFSTSDNTDPRTNGRLYRYRI